MKCKMGETNAVLSELSGWEREEQSDRSLDDSPVEQIQSRHDV